MKSHWKPSKTKAREFAQAMSEIDAFCAEHGIDHSKSSDSYYFVLNGCKYRVSNHTVEASNAAAFDEMGQRVRDAYHPGGRQDDTIYITAGKTRIREIYEDLAAGYTLDKRGNRISKEG